MNIRESKNIPENWIRVKDTVYVKRWVDQESLIEDYIPRVTSRVRLSGLSGKRENPFRGERNVFVYISSIVAFHCQGIKLCHEGLTRLSRI